MINIVSPWRTAGSQILARTGPYCSPPCRPRPRPPATPPPPPPSCRGAGQRTEKPPLLSSLLVFYTVIHRIKVRPGQTKSPRETQNVPPTGSAGIVDNRPLSAVTTGLVDPRHGTLAQCITAERRDLGNKDSGRAEKSGQTAR